MNNKHKKYHILYKTTNIINGKYYIGVHSTYDLDDGYLGSGTYLKNSINKYGEENHSREIIEFFDSVVELYKREKIIVNLSEVKNKQCMNLRVGGKGGWSSEQQRKNAKKSNIRQQWLRKNDKEWVLKTRKNKSKSNKLQYENGTRKGEYFYDRTGKKHRTESKIKIGKANSKHQRGSGNSQYGTIWITNDFKNKKIKKNDVIPYGWKKGRVLNKK